MYLGFIFIDVFSALKINEIHFKYIIFILKISIYFNKMSSDLDRQIEQLRNCEIIKESEVKALCAKAREILVEESNV